MDKRFIKVDGEAYIAINSLLDTMQAMLFLRDEMVQDNPELVVIVPGSDMALASLAKTLLQLRDYILAGQDPEDMAKELVQDIYKFLGDQDKT